MHGGLCQDCVQKMDQIDARPQPVTIPTLLKGIEKRRFGPDEHEKPSVIYYINTTLLYYIGFPALLPDMTSVHIHWNPPHPYAAKPNAVPMTAPSDYIIQYNTNGIY